MITINIADFDLGQICDSGQCFRMYRVDDSRTKSTGMEEEFEVIARDRYLRVGQNPSGAFGNQESGCHSIVFDCSKEEFEDFWKIYFDIEVATDYSAIKQMVPERDAFLTKAINLGAGIRILNQDLWEMIVSFLISQQNNIPRIHKCIDNISRKYGIAKENSLGEVYYSFPTPESLANLEEDALMECNLGYRSKYVVRTAREIVEGKFDLNDISKMKYLDARAKLLEMYGVGVKVADCICLFALHLLEAFPVDTHIKQVLEREYGVTASIASNNSLKVVTDTLHPYCEYNPLSRYPGVQGVIQQYIFYAELQQSLK